MARAPDRFPLDLRRLADDEADLALTHAPYAVLREVDRVAPAVLPVALGAQRGLQDVDAVLDVRPIPIAQRLLIADLPAGAHEHERAVVTEAASVHRHVRADARERSALRRDRRDEPFGLGGELARSDAWAQKLEDATIELSVELRELDELRVSLVHRDR